MKTINYYLIFLTIFILILIFLVKDLTNNKKSINLSFCGNNICEKNEGSYCLDCNLSCKSEFCNSKINILCDNCSIESELLKEFLSHQTTIYNCLSDYYGYRPTRLIYHTIKEIENEKEVCNNKSGCYIQGGNFGEREGIIQEQIPGLIDFGDFKVTNKENVGFEIHELAHAFTYYGLGRVPQWFNEGISIYAESKLNCHENFTSKDQIKEIYELYNNKNITLPIEESQRISKSNHIIGARYFGYLDEEYGCNQECISQIIYSLYEYRQNYTKNDLRTEVITNSVIKQKSEKIIGQNLTELFNLLEISY